MFAFCFRFFFFSRFCRDFFLGSYFLLVFFSFFSGEILHPTNFSIKLLNVVLGFKFKVSHSNLPFAVALFNY